MMRKFSTAFLVLTICGLVVVLVLAPMAFCQTQAPAPGTNAVVKSPDAVLLERAIQAIKTSHYAEARTLLKKLIRSYPDSDCVARAKFSMGDAWYAEGAFQRALMEYQDFIAFFPNRPEVMEARQKIDAIQKRTEM
jgi:TolA-binding protein